MVTPEGKLHICYRNQALWLLSVGGPTTRWETTTGSELWVTPKVHEYVEKSEMDYLPVCSDIVLLLAKNRIRTSLSPEDSQMQNAFQNDVQTFTHMQFELSVCKI